MDKSIQREVHAKGHALSRAANELVNEYELELIENALIAYGMGLGPTNFREKEGTASVLKKLNYIRGAACCNAIRIEPV